MSSSPEPTSNRPQDNDPKKPQRDPGWGGTPVPPRGNLFQFVLFISLGLAFIAFFVFSQLRTPRVIPFTQLQTLIQNGEVERLDVRGNVDLLGKLRDDASALAKEFKIEQGRFRVLLPPGENQYPFLRELLALDETYRKAHPEVPELIIDQQADYSEWGRFVIMILISTAVLLLFLFLFILPRMRDSMGGNVANTFTKSPAKRYQKTEESGRSTFKDVAGMDNAKAELQEIVEYLREPQRFEKLGAEIPKGVLLVGPPGTGKTLLARAVAGEAGVPFFSVNGSEFIQMFVGVGASRVRDLFRNAKENAPCLLFIDEIDAVGRMRGAGVGGGSDEREQTLNQILSEMDGFTPNETVIVLAATNRPDVLDSALLRPGRFDRHITIDRPTWKGRLEILKVHVRNKPLADDVDLESIAKQMTGMTGADLRNLANEAALLATRANQEKITNADFERAADRVRLGPKREEILSQENKRQIAVHEAGHAIASWFQPEAMPPSRVSIIPRGQALGVNIPAIDEDRHHYGADFFRAQLVFIMGGRAADRLMYQQAFAGHSNDLKQATRIARAMVAQYGMSQRIGPISLRIGEEHVFLGKEIQEARDFSEGTASLIDEEVMRILREADERAFELMTQHRRELEALVDALMEQEELSEIDLERILQKRPQSSNGSEQSRNGVAASASENRD
ncbi:ATP-dependent zinc metalloprotease FtsH [Tuwongella immobilis]|uniref:ATP-dependent zinc metalloprotease FtsH n=1 Tax=Tuwongella immobilis TaxID=692036 RepID=A0A6C2YQN0_9BACT|nr:ATP-dependent zinc metalloprotease FtsH [Tuwongella immobilis]VIP03192.1 cell division protein : ATP-dependent zinc metalloprotease FtsH OS=Isosphaera pallida (strain ATCC 43644 / DSM 9630 / IS1B) GN=ftsH PE=3 SV=1: FtsH_ext: AAA: Peptidase_M41 [Tuwongella immobilis]VTS03663.1 cell division protein : ATP-dependent zinc metalloprotease FtsH OS=Isosphaera pallida (strain ATCC 43644 / DSM 9630 / IS1B) GN=ftsH PE=3 SV=1: FtsH_ext: AAA: Peptidase_M41 [Tuwongella immobilis]